MNPSASVYSTRMNKFFPHVIFDMKLEHMLEKELEESKLWLSREREESPTKEISLQGLNYCHGSLKT